MSRGDLLQPILRQVTELAARGARDLRHLERSSRFLAGLRQFDPRPDDVFISSYPRSGTTWLQLLTHLVVRGGDLDFRHIDAVVPWFERSLALGRSSAADFAALPSPRLFKSHLPPRWLPPRGRYVYVCRDGLDVAVSYYSLYRTHLGFAGSLEEFFERFLRGRVQYRSWFDHVAAWQAERDRPWVLWLEYERMRSEPERTITELAGFLGVALSSKRIAEIAALSSFESMQAHEALFDHATNERFHEGKRGGHFVRRGEIGTGRKSLSDAQRNQFARQLRSARRRGARLMDLPAFLH